MKVVGITGRSGCGKSSATNFLREKGYPVGDNVYTVGQAEQRLLPLLKGGSAPC